MKKKYIRKMRLYRAPVHLTFLFRDKEDKQIRWLTSSVTRLGDLLHFGQLFKAYGNNYFAQIAHIFRQFL